MESSQSPDQQHNQMNAQMESLQIDAQAKRHEKFADQILHVLKTQDLLKVHAIARVKSDFTTIAQDDGTLKSQMVLSVAADICATPPPKKALLLALYELFYRQQMTLPPEMGGDSAISEPQLWELIETLSRPCGEIRLCRQKTDPWGPRLHLVRDCCTEVPVLGLGCGELEQLRDLGEEQPCCAMRPQGGEAKLVQKYGKIVAAKMVEAHMEDVAASADAQIALTIEAWEQVAKAEMLELLRWGSEPQEHSARKGPLSVDEIMAILVEAAGGQADTRSGDVDMKPH